MFDEDFNEHLSESQSFFRDFSFDRLYELDGDFSFQEETCLADIKNVFFTDLPKIISPLSTYPYPTHCTCAKDKVFKAMPFMASMAFASLLSWACI